MYFSKLDRPDQFSLHAFKNAVAATDDASLLENHSSLNLSVCRSIFLTSDTHRRVPHAVPCNYTCCVFYLSAATSAGDCYSPQVLELCI